MKSWIRAILLMEIKNILSYRLEFWINFLGGTIASFLVAYCVWDNIFSQSAQPLIGEMSLQGMVIYYVVAPLAGRVLDADSMGFMSREIYEGSLNKYLIYPVNFFIYKAIVFLVRGLFYLLQVFFCLGVFLLFMKIPPEFSITFSSIMIFVFFSLLAMVVYFLMVSIIEVISFWADNIWSLRVLNFLLVSFFGGTMIPLNLFPHWSQQFINFLPFRSMIFLPTQFLLGKSWDLIPTAFWSLIIWGLLFSVVLRIEWKRGLKTYTGVGM